MMDIKSFREDVTKYSLEESLIRNGVSLKEAFELCLNLQRIVKSNDDRYIQKKIGSEYYIIRKFIDGKEYKLGYFELKSDAMKVRDYFVENGWNVDELDEICDLLNVRKIDKRGSVK